MKNTYVDGHAIESITDANALAIYVWVTSMDGHTYTQQELLAHFEWMTEEQYDVAMLHLDHLGFVIIRKTTTYEFVDSGGAA